MLRIEATNLAVCPVMTPGNWWRRLTTAKTWVLSQRFEAWIGDYRITIPAGTRTDFASVPRVLKACLPDDFNYSRAAVIHDRLYQEGHVSKWLADAILFEAARRLDKVAWFWAAAAWGAVACFGFGAWNGHRRKKG